MMSSLPIKQELDNYIKEKSGFDTKRNYIGMSNIASCPVQLFKDYFSPPVIPPMNTLLNAFRGYEIERMVKRILTEIGMFKPGSERELIQFNGLYQGHTDGEMIDGSLCEIKSVNSDKFNKIKVTDKLPFRNFAQIQEYLLYGGYTKCYCVIICTETFEPMVREILPSRNVLSRNNQRIGLVVEAIKSKVQPECVCGYCKNNPTEAQ